MTSMPKCSKKRRSSVASVALIMTSGISSSGTEVVAQQAALADLVAEAIEEGDAVLVGEIHLALRGLERGQREGREHEETADAQGHRLAGELIEAADDALDLEAVEERGVAAPPVAKAGPGAVEAGIDP